MDVDEDDDLDDRGRIAPHDLPAWCAMALGSSSIAKWPEKVSF
jgi:hypothetical protein